MSKVYKLREWLTLGDAARYLSAALGEDLSKADVIRLALDGYLHLSVNVLSPIPARKGSLVLASEYYPTEIIESYKKSYGNEFVDGHVFISEKDSEVNVEGIFEFDLQSCFYVRRDLLQAYQDLTDALVERVRIFV